MKVITLGPAGTFSHHVALETFPRATLSFSPTLDGVFEELSRYDAAVVPFENSLSGFIETSINHLLACEYSVTECITVPIAHHLAGFGALPALHTLFVFSHTYKQCYHTLQTLIPEINVEYTSSNGMSAALLKEAKSDGYAAVVPSCAIEEYGLPILKHNVQDCRQNHTRFLILKKRKSKGSRHLSLLFSKYGLTTIQEALQSKGVELHSIQETPLKKLDCHCYCIEFCSSPDALTDFHTKFLGSYNATQTVR